MENTNKLFFNFDVTWTLITVIISVIIYLYLNMRETYKYWERKGVAYLKPLPIFGSSLPVLRGELSLIELYSKAYKQFPNEKVVGLFEFQRPILVLKNLKLIEKVLVKDFPYFTDHLLIDHDDTLVSVGLFQARGDKWRALRSKISPTFTSGKLKLMIKGMLDCSEEMLNTFRKNINTDYEVKEALSTYVTDVTASLLFGFHIKDNNARKEFESKATSFFSTSQFVSLKTELINMFPKLSKLCGFKFLNNEVGNYFYEIINNNFEQRTEGKYRNDFVQLLLNLKDKGKVEVQSIDKDDAYLYMDSKSPIEDSVEINKEFIIAQAVQFLVAGFLPIQHALIFTMLEWSKNPEIQERARLEIKTVLGKYGSYTDEALREMTYLEQCIQEILRLYKLSSFLFRECTKQYTTDDGLVIEKGTKLIIPTNSIHKDPQYFEDPELFKPERNPPNSLKGGYSFMPFGAGPRICIGFRFALFVLKVGLAKILENFKITGSPKNKFPIEYNQTGIAPFPITKIYLNITPA